MVHTCNIHVFVVAWHTLFISVKTGAQGPQGPQGLMSKSKRIRFKAMPSMFQPWFVSELEASCPNLP
jgi:hypothetical protein